MSSHKNCCGRTRRPRTLAALAALPYPSNPNGNDDNKNRIQNPEEKEVKLAHVKKSRKGWWFRIDPNHPPPLLDGSGDALSRGGIVRSEGAKALHPEVDHLVCLNAASLKALPVPPNGKREVCGFTWDVSLTGTAPSKDKSKIGGGSGWMPLSAIQFTKPGSRHHIDESLEHWRCCANKYGTWGQSLAKGHPKRTFKFRTTAELLKKIASVGEGHELASYFHEDEKGAITRLLKRCKGEWSKLRESFGILPSCATGNRLTDYMAKGADYKNGFYGDGYTNLNANLSVNSTRAIMAPIPLDIFPANHEFTRLSFGKQNHVLGFVYSVPQAGLGKRIGRVVWYFGYCDTKGDRAHKERRFGWVPALALK